MTIHRLSPTTLLDIRGKVREILLAWVHGSYRQGCLSRDPDSAGEFASTQAAALPPDFARLASGGLPGLAHWLLERPPVYRRWPIPRDQAWRRRRCGRRGWGRDPHFWPGAGAGAGLVHGASARGCRISRSSRPLYGLRRPR